MKPLMIVVWGQNLKKFVLILLLLFTVPVFALEYKDSSSSNFIFADWIFWKLTETGGAENWAQVIPPEGANRPVKMVDVPFNWNSGYRVGVGHNGNQQQYDVVFYYTHYRVTGDSNVSGVVYSAFTGNYFENNPRDRNGVFGPTYTNAGMEYDFSYNTVDFELGRKFKIDPILTLRPFIGLKTAFINQDMDTIWKNPTPANFKTATEDLENDFWGIGPSVGLNSTWPVYTTTQHSLSVIGNFSGAYLWGRWKFADVFQDDIPQTISINFKDLNGASPMLKGMVGLTYSGLLAKVNFNASIGYEAEVWFNQLQFYSFNGGRLNNLLALQGGVLDFTFNF